MGVDMNEAEYLKLWRYFDKDGDGKISYTEWNNVVGPLIHPLSDIDLDRLGCAQGDHFAFLLHAQQFGLKRQGHFGDLVEQQGAAVRGAEETFGSGIGSGERALLVAEQHRLQHGFGHVGAIDGDERRGGTR